MREKLKTGLLGIALAAATAAPAFAQGAPAPTINSGDTAWVLVSAALVLLMTPGLAFFYGGLVRSKNSLNTLMMSYVALGVVGLEWVLFGYSLAFAPGSQWLGQGHLGQKQERLWLRLKRYPTIQFAIFHA